MKVALLYKPTGAESEISILSTKHIFNNLKSTFDVYKVPFDIKSTYHLNDYDLVINLVYGELGEDGTISSFLESKRIPFLGPSTNNCFLTYNKIITKTTLQKNEIKTPNIAYNIPCVYKPIFGGSS